MIDERVVNYAPAYKYLTPPTATRGVNHIWGREGTTTLCSSTGGRHSTYVLAVKPREGVRLCLQCKRKIVESRRK